MFDSFELNKIAGSVLAGVLLLFLIDAVGGAFVHTDHVEKQAFVPEGTEMFEAGNGGPPKEVAAPVIESSVPLIAAADLEKGAKVFKKCAACHSVDAAKGNGTGPNLANVVGRATASADVGFGFSGALSGLGGDWGYEELDGFLRKPKEYAPGTKMAFAGLKKVSDRAAVIAYLRANTENAPALPVAEMVEDAVEAAADAAEGAADAMNEGAMHH